MTEPERAILRENVRVYKELSGNPLAEAGHLLVLTIMMSLLASWVWIGFLRLLGVIPRVAEWSGTSAGIWSVILISYAISGSIAWSTLKDVKAFRTGLVKAETDLAAGVVVTDQIMVLATKGFVEPEHLMRKYCLPGADGRVFTIYDYDSANMDGGGRSKQTKLRFATELNILTFPISGDVNYTFSGAPVRKPPCRRDECPSPRLARSGKILGHSMARY